MCNFSTSDAASIQVRLLFEDGLYANALSLQSAKAVWHNINVTDTAKAKLDFVSVTKLIQNVTNILECKEGQN